MLKEVLMWYTWGTTASPEYKPSKWGYSGEAEKVTWAPEIITYEKLVRHVYATIDYEDGEGQFCDRGRSYSPAIYYKTDAERLIVERLAPKNSVVPIEPERVFYPVREEHQDFYKKRSLKYKYYRFSCGRDSRLDALNGN